jgi:hypothetical protein
MPEWFAALFDDNPSEVDLLGLAPIATAIAATVMDPRLNPVAIGINSPWGGGKSTALLLVEKQLANDPTALVVHIDPWEFVDSGDARGTLIARVLDGLETSYRARAAALKDEAGVGEKAAAKAKELVTTLNQLRRRISWAKVAQVALKSAVTMTPNLVDLVDALTPRPGEAEDKPETLGMKAFRDEFGSIVRDLPSVSRVVVLVDDLDRCLPSDVLGAFEAIKLFLSVKGMAFVVAADDAFIRDSLRAALSRHGRGRFADRYTEKVIQLPFTLPLLTPQDAEAYVALLYTSVDAEAEQMATITAEVMRRRGAGSAPYVTSAMADGLPAPETITRAASLVRGMSAATSSTPRQLKRFLNNFAVRSSLLAATQETVQPDVVMKLWILEQHFGDEFQSLSRKSAPERAELLASWERDGDVDTKLTEWAVAGPMLSTLPDDVTAYLSLAASVLTDVSLGGNLGSDDALILAGLLSGDPIARRGAQGQLENPMPREDDVVGHLAAAITGSHREAAIESLSQIAERRPDLMAYATPVLLRADVLRSIEITDLVYLAEYREVLDALRTLHSNDPEFVDAIRDELEGGI